MLHHIHTSAVQKAVKYAMRSSSLTRPGSCHSLRHSFATQLISQGTDIRTVRGKLERLGVRIFAGAVGNRQGCSDPLSLKVASVPMLR
ncbi:tyrosine-type recombinase/integrase [Halomonas sp. ISL-56]|uniref:tyrosine-type recombinase/integrase n=1 Tax=Halomonas sp. ISL-56 TaxID=2819149 RepID=UPI00333CA60B